VVSQSLSPKPHSANQVFGEFFGQFSWNQANTVSVDDALATVDVKKQAEAGRAATHGI
jgi:hypothetical protein